MDELRERARLILQARGIEHELVADEIHVRHGSAHVRIAFRVAGGRSIIAVFADVLTDCTFEDPLVALRCLNERNLSLPFGKLSLDEASRTVRLDYQLLADHLDDEELVNALVAVAKAADDHDDELQGELGGRRAVDRLTATSHPAED